MTAQTHPSQVAADRARDAAARAAIGDGWTRADLPGLAGRTVLITGGTRGLGRAVAIALAERGAEVTVTGTRSDRAQAAAEAIGKTLRARGCDVPAVRGAGLDLADLDGVAEFAHGWDGAIDLMINNAGIMWGPYATTSTGVERQLATNFLGHFALVGRLLPHLTATRGARIVSVSSTYHQYGGLTERDLSVSSSDYRPSRAYGTSKLAMLAFARELGRRAAAERLDLTSVAAHPGYANTDLQTGQLPPGRQVLMRAANRFLAVPVETGADPVLCAATVPELPSGTFIGPSRLMGYRGRPGLATSSAAANNPALARALWAWATIHTGVRYLESGEATRVTM